MMKIHVHKTVYITKKTTQALSRRPYNNYKNTKESNITFYKCYDDLHEYNVSRGNFCTISRP